MSLKQTKQLEHTLETYTYSHCNMRNISIYSCNIDIKHLQHTSETPKILKTYVCNMPFQLKHLLAASQMETRRRVEVTSVLAGGTELAGYSELDGGAQRDGGGGSRAAMAQRVGGRGAGGESGWSIRWVRAFPKLNNDVMPTLHS